MFDSQPLKESQGFGSGRRVNTEGSLFICSPLKRVKRNDVCVGNVEHSAIKGTRSRNGKIFPVRLVLIIAGCVKQCLLHAK